MPASHVVKTKISVFALVLVSVGAVPPLHFIADPQVTERLVPSAVNAKVKPYAVLDAGIFENVMLVIAAFSETANTLPLAQLRASTPAEIAGAVLTSFRPVIVGVVIAGDASTTNFDPVPVCEAIEVVLPTEVITPVRFALVVTVEAFPFNEAVIVPAEKFPEASR